MAPSLHPSAHACGGTFCDGQQMPVDQTGENILFVMDGGFVETHVQIQYDGGDASKFAWIVPVPEVPEIEVGSFRLLQNALDGSVPTFGNQATNTCFDDSNTTGFGFISEPDGGGVGGGDDPEVVAQDTAGAFEYVVLSGGTSASVMQWLQNEGYALDVAAPEILDQYIAEGHVFVAFKLAHNEGLEDIHPVVIRYPGTEPCIPIRLTRIAAKEDMDIRALFLGEARVFPTTYRHVVPNDVRFDWPQRAPNYAEVISKAVDEAGGRAFVTEYAGSSATISPVGLYPEGLDAEIFETLDPLEVVDALEQQGLMSCGDETCVYQHDLIRSLLLRWLPVPAEVEEEAFYACLSCYADQLDVAAWDGAGFAADYRERILDPMVHAWNLIETWPYLTRLYTRISPDEMLSDPMFAEVYDLGDQGNRLTSQQANGCCMTITRLPSGREVVLVDGGWPTWSTAMPFAERIEEYNPKGPPLPIVDHADDIDARVASHNAPLWCAEGDTDGATSTGGQDPGDTGPGPDGDPSDPSGATTTTSDSDSAGQGSADVSGCACATRPSRGELAWLPLVAIPLLLRRRR